jgi:hypothetical protein
MQDYIPVAVSHEQSTGDGYGSIYIKHVTYLIHPKYASQAQWVAANNKEWWNGSSWQQWVNSQPEGTVVIKST